MENHNSNKNPKQEQVWNSIASDWNKWKKTSDPKVSDFVKNSKGNLLDLGCGSGRNFSETKAKIYGIDFSSEMIKYAKEKSKKININSECVVGESFNLPYKDNFFDNAIAIAVLHCIETSEKREKTIKELYRVLKPKAKLLIKVWNKDHKRFKDKGKEKYIQWLDKGSRYYYFYTEDELKKDLEKAGFKILSSESKSPDNSVIYDEIVIIAEK